MENSFCNVFYTVVSLKDVFHEKTKNGCERDFLQTLNVASMFTSARSDKDWGFKRYLDFGLFWNSNICRPMLNRRYFSTIRSHGTKSHMLVSKLHSGTSKQSNSYQPILTCLCFVSPTMQLAHQLCDFVPCDRIVQRANCQFSCQVTCKTDDTIVHSLSVRFTQV